MIKYIVPAAILAVFFSGSAMAAPVVDYTGGSGKMPDNLRVIEDFDNLKPGTAIGKNAYALNTSSGIGAIPAFGSSGNYGSVLGGGSYTIKFDPTSRFGFVLGSLDTYNSLRLFFEDNTSLIYSGSEIIGNRPPPFADGNQKAGHTNGVVSYATGSGSRIIGAQFNSGANSFEFDNIATAAPEPAAWAMMIIGFGAIGVAMRSKQRALSLTTA